MSSHEVLREAMDKVGVKFVAGEMNLSSSLLYKWCQPKDGPNAPGAANPLDRLAKIYDITGDTRPVSWLCRHANGYFVPNIPPHDPGGLPLIKVTQSILKEFSELLEEVSMSIENDDRILGDEAKRIRKEWEELKSLTESFVSGCEQGAYR